MREDEARPTRRRERRRPTEPPPLEETLDVPRWTHPKVSAYDLEPEERRRERRQNQRRTSQRAAPARDGYLLGMAIAPGATSIVALAVSVVPLLSGTGDIPAGIVLVLMVQVAALVLLSQTGANAWATSWISVGFLTSIMMPMLALQVSLLHEPYVSLQMGSARPAMLATLVVLGLYGAYCVWVVWISQNHPPGAAVLMMPPTLAIPAMIGQAGNIDQRAALIILSEVTLITAIAAAISWLFPGWTQLMIGAGALAFEFVRLWLGGNGPWRHETSGSIVSALYIAMLVTAVLAIVLVPVLAALANAPRIRRRVNRTLGRTG